MPVTGSHKAIEPRRTFIVIGEIGTGVKIVSLY